MRWCRRRSRSYLPRPIIHNVDTYLVYLAEWLFRDTGCGHGHQRANEGKTCDLTSRIGVVRSRKLSNHGPASMTWPDRTGARAQIICKFVACSATWFLFPPSKIGWEPTAARMEPREAVSKSIRIDRDGVGWYGIANSPVSKERDRGQLYSTCGLHLDRSDRDVIVMRT